MGFDRFLKQREIRKTIDPGTGSLPVSNTIPDLPKDTLDDRDIQLTTIQTLINDLIVESQSVQTQIGSTINDIYEANKSDSGFVEYVDMIKTNYWTPTTLLTDKTSRPNPTYSPAQIKAAERDVYRRVNDPRAPFVGDLYDMLADAGLSEYTLKRVWDQITQPNDLYSEFDSSNRLPKFALYREREHLNQLKYSNDRIKRNTPQRLSNEFMIAMSDKIVNQIYVADPKAQIQQVNQLINFMKQMRTLLTIASIFNSENWEKFAGNIKDIYGDILGYTANKVAKTQAYAFVGGIQDAILDFTEDINDILPLGLDTNDIPELRELRNQIDQALTKNLEKVEDDLVYREGIQAKLEEQRQLLILNSKKNSKTKQFIEVLNTIITYLDQLRTQLYNITGNLRYDMDYLTQNLTNKADEWIRSTGAKSSKSVKVEPTVPLYIPFNPNSTTP